MKILYVGTDVAEAQAIATAVAGLGERVRVSCRSGLDRVAKWIDETHGLRVLVVEAEPDESVWRSVLTYAAGLPAPVPVVVIVPEDIGSDLQPLALDAHECVARNPSLYRDLPAAITRAIDHARERRLETATRDMVYEQFREAAIEVERVRLSHALAVVDAERLVRREAELSAQLDWATRAHVVLERRLADAETALSAAETRAAEERQSIAELAAERQRELERKASEEIDKRRELQAALGAVRQDLEAKAAALDALAAREAELTLLFTAATTGRAIFERRLEDAAEREAELQGQIRREHAAAAALEEKVADANAALDETRRQKESAAADVARLTEREASLTSELTDAHAALRDEQHRHDAALAMAAGEIAERQSQFDRDLAQAEAERAGLTSQLRELEEARDQARREHEMVVADVTRLTEREAELEGRLKEERETRDGLMTELADAHASLRDEQHRHDAALAMAAGEIAERQANFNEALAQAEAERTDLTAQLRVVEEARDQARREHQAAVADMARLTEREAELDGRLKEEQATRNALEQAVADKAAELRDAEQRHDVALATASGELAERQAHFDRERAEAAAERDVLTAQLREVEEARDQARREHQSAVADVTRLTERELELEGRLKDERALGDALEQAAAAAASALRDAEKRHDAALAMAADKLADRSAQFDRERAEAEAERSGLTAQLREVEEARDQARREQADLEAQLDVLRAAGLVQAAQFDEQRRDYECRLVEGEVVNSTLARDHAAALAARDNDIEQLRISLTARVEELHQSRADNHRLFQLAPLPMFRCTKEGMLTQANRMLTMLVGHRSAEELRGADLAAAIFESPDDLSWLIERCLGSRGKESTETTWRRKDGSRLLVRVSACATSSDLIECGVEDLTPIRVLHDRLSQAHRMEAVGRLATEVAVTCGSLLGGVQQNAQQWLMTDDSHSASRHHGEMLLEEISRAAGLLRQLAAYGDEESRRPAVVELRTVVRDVAPILKRVAGDAVEVELPAASAPLNVDAGAERVKRLLVNLAAYGRERMPSGGQLKIELGTIVVDRHFAAKYPNVRLGPHALVTVTERRRAARTDAPVQLQDKEAGSSTGSVAVQTGVDLGTLQELVSECGGHLWMTVEPGGDMVVKIRLPLVTSYGEPPRRKLVPGGRVRTLGQWFQN